MSVAPWLWMGVSATVLVLAACGQSTTAERKPGDDGYPSDNPRPIHLLDLRIVMPPGLRGRLRAEYTATQNVASCRKIVGVDDDLPYYLSIPLHLTRSGEVYRQILAIDRFQPGRCGWDFAGIKYSVAAQGPVRDELLTYTGWAPYTGRGEQEEVQLDVWCASFPTEPSSRTVCGGLDLLSYAFPGSIGRRLIDSVPMEQRQDGPPGYIGSDVTVVTVRFHDLDSMRREHLRISADAPVLQ